MEDHPACIRANEARIFKAFVHALGREVEVEARGGAHAEEILGKMFPSQAGFYIEHVRG